jgi:preprotein translocase subunit SecA
MQSEYDSLKKRIDNLERTVANAQGELSDAKKDKDETRIKKAQNVLEKSETELETSQVRLENTTQYYEVEYDRKSAHMTHEGVTAAQDIAGVGSFFTGSNMEWPHLLEQSLRAHVVFEKEKDYVVMEGKVVIVDEFTGRLMHGRQWSDGLHQAVEAKESVQVKEETQTLATITLQNFFKLYGQISGMTGTAETEADEFMNIYKLDVVVIPTNKPCVRDDREDLIYKSIKEKFNAITEEINDISNEGRPILIGTISIEKSEAISNALKKRFGVEHEVLNAKQHTREAAIVEKAGQQHTDRHGKSRGNVTIATNMAGRGTDIKLGEGVADIGGLHILGTERHEARRIDNQLRGRAGRQGDNGSSQFFLSFEDDLMALFAPEWTVKALSWIGWQEGEPIYNKRISKGIEKAQKKVEERNFESRKSLMEYDEVMDYQRNVFYGRRRKILSGSGLKQIIQDMIQSAIQTNCKNILSGDYPQNCIIEWARNTFSSELRHSDIASLKADEIEQVIKEQAKKYTANEISLSLGEYLEDYSDPKSWNIQGLCKWAMSAFMVNLSPSKVKHMDPDEIEEQLVEASAAQIDKKDCSTIDEFLKEDFAARTFTDWANNKFNIKLTADEIKGKNPDEVQEILTAKAEEKYKQREIEYPVEFAMNLVYGPQGANVYGFENLSQWAMKKYKADMPVERIQNLKPAKLHGELLQLSESFNDGKLDEEIDNRISSLDTDGLISWANDRFDTQLTKDDLPNGDNVKEKLSEIGSEFLRRELSDLERYVLLQVYDSAWKDHLYAMDHLKSSIWMRSMAEKDPKIEYKREGHKMFSEMLDSVEDRVTDIIFKVQLAAGERMRSVYNVSSSAHDEVGQFAMAERQRAAAQAPQGETQVKKIKLDTPKVGRNELCPCGSGKKYKKCCGSNA